MAEEDIFSRLDMVGGGGGSLGFVGGKNVEKRRKCKRNRKVFDMRSEKEGRERKKE
jgi:hypothetical protein